MTVEQDMLRADLRTSMTTPLPDYVVDSEAGRRVGKVIGGTAGREERMVRASDSRGHSTDRLPDEPRNGGPNLLLWTVSTSVSVCTVGLLGAMAYWRFG